MNNFIMKVSVLFLFLIFGGMTVHLYSQQFSPLWQKQYSFTDFSTKPSTFQAYKLLEASDGGICMATYQHVSSSALLKLNAAGQVDWFRITPDQFLPQKDIFFIPSPTSSALFEINTHFILRQSYMPIASFPIFKMGYFSVFKEGVRGIGLVTIDTVNKSLYTDPSDVLPIDKERVLLVERANGNGAGSFVPAVNIIRDNSQISEHILLDTSKIFQDRMRVISACRIDNDRIAYMIGTSYEVGISKTDVEITILNKDYSTFKTLVFEQKNLGLNNNLFYPSQLLYDGEDFVVVGFTSLAMNQDAYQCFLRIGMDGTVKNTKTFTEPIVFRRAIIGKEKTIAGAGFYRVKNKSQFCYGEVSFDFSKHSIQNWGDTTKYSNILNDIVLCRDGGYYVAGGVSINDTHSDLYVARIEKTVLSVDNDESSNMIEVHPNPANTHLKVMVHQPETQGQFSVQMYNIMGEVVTQKIEVLDRHELQIDTHELPSGMYNVTIRNNKTNSTTVKSVVIVR